LGIISLQVDAAGKSGEGYWGGTESRRQAETGWEVKGGGWGRALKRPEGSVGKGDGDDGFRGAWSREALEITGPEGPLPVLTG